MGNNPQFFRISSHGYTIDKKSNQITDALGSIHYFVVAKDLNMAMGRIPGGGHRELVCTYPDESQFRRILPPKLHSDISEAIRNFHHVATVVFRQERG